MHDFIRPIVEVRREAKNDIEGLFLRRYLKVPYVFMPIMMR